MHYILFMSFGMLLLSIQPAYATSLPGIIAPTCYTFGLVILGSVYIRIFKVYFGKDKYLSFSKSINDNAVSFFMIIPIYYLLLVWDGISRKWSILGSNANYVSSLSERINILTPHLFVIFLALFLFNLFEFYLNKKKSPQNKSAIREAIQNSIFPFAIVLMSFTLTVMVD